jgi:hypothetical protein
MTRKIGTLKKRSSKRAKRNHTKKRNMKGKGPLMSKNSVILNTEEYTGEPEHRQSNNKPSIKQKGGNQEEKDDYLLDAIRMDEADKVTRALNNGADINRANSAGDTPLYVASEIGHVEVVRILLENGADINRAESNGQTPLMIAVDSGHLEVVEVLLEYGANLNAETNDGDTAFDMVNEGVFPEIATLLKTEQKVRGHKQKAMELVTNRVEKVPSLQTLAHRNLDTHATMSYNKAVMDGTKPPLGSKLGGKRKTKKSKKSNKRFKTTRRKNYLGGTRSPQDILNQIREGRQQIATAHQHVLQEEESLASNSWASPDTSMNSSFESTYSANSDDGETTHEDISFEEEEPADDDDPLNQGFILEDGETL